MAECIFCDMGSGAMDVTKLHDDELVFAIRDINPRAPVHLMIIPKQHIPTLADVEESHGPVLSRLFTVGARLAEQAGLGKRGYRFAINCGSDGGQTIFHLHMHLVGGRRLGAEG